MASKAYIAGVGMIPFTKPGRSLPYDEMGGNAAQAALADAGVEYKDVQQVYAGFIYGDSCSGQKAAYRLGMTGVPVVNVNNNCASGSTALVLARQAVLSGQADCVLAMGFEQMQPGALKSLWDDRKIPFEHGRARFSELMGAHDELPSNGLKVFGGAGAEHMKRYGTKLETFAKIRAKASRHAANNPLSIFRDVLSVEEVLASPTLWPGVLTRLMACPPTCGGAAAVVVSEAFAKKHGLRTDVFIAGQGFTTDNMPSWAEADAFQLCGNGMTKSASRQAYEQAGVGPKDVQVIELHDCFAQAELVAYEGLGLCPEGEAEKLVEAGDNTYGGRWVVNPSGGLLSKGHPIGATGLAQCYELTNQLRGTADKRQVPGARIALQHNLGLGGAGVVTIYQRAD